MRVVIVYVDEDEGSHCGFDPYGCDVAGLNRYLSNLSGGYVSVNEHNGANAGLSVKVSV